MFVNRCRLSVVKVRRKTTTAHRTETHKPNQQISFADCLMPNNYNANNEQLDLPRFVHTAATNECCTTKACPRPRVAAASNGTGPSRPSLQNNNNNQQQLLFSTLSSLSLPPPPPHALATISSPLILLSNSPSPGSSYSPLPPQRATFAASARFAVPRFFVVVVTTTKLTTSNKCHKESHQLGKKSITSDGSIGNNMSSVAPAAMSALVDNDHKTTSRRVIIENDNNNNSDNDDKDDRSGKGKSGSVSGGKNGVPPKRKFKKSNKNKKPKKHAI